ncbi:CBL-interacting protein kinase 31 [Hordeum vulgare]|nr:CBL-interacting protein kinase 31 [Hordeum vulgare]
MAGGGEGVGEAALVDVVEEVVGVVGHVPEAVDPGGEGGVGGAAPGVLDVGGGHLEAEELVGEARASRAPPGREGTFAKVRFAKDTESGDHVAIKILDKAKVQKHGLVEQIRREICTMKLIQHPNVVRLHEVMGSKARIFIVLEYVTGGELHDIIVRTITASLVSYFFVMGV